MILDLRDVFAGGSDISIDSSLQCGADFVGDDHIADLHFRGVIKSRADVVSLEGTAEFTYCAPCDRCAEPVSRDMRFDISHIIAAELSDEDTAGDDIIITENMQLDLDELIRSDIILMLPTKFLCKPDCKGVCPGCMKNLNFEPCVCKKEIDPRLAKLSEFFDSEGGE